METVTSQKNPIIPGRGVCDPHMRVYGDRVYLYASHDANPDGYDFEMHDWHVWSSDDLVTWRHEATIRPEDTYIGASRECWAPDAATRNGKYYFYYSNCVHDTGVCVADHPAGPFVDPLGKPLLPPDLTPTRSYDPAVFIDDDGEAYIVFGVFKAAGGDGYYIARLNEDMISLAEPPRRIDLDDEADDKPALHKHNDTYYLTWQSFYATSNSVYGPYRLVGNTGAAYEHGCYFPWNGQWFHAFGVYDPTAVYRSSAMCYVHYRANGQMVEDPMIVEFGVGQYDATWNRIEAEWYMAAHDIRKQENCRTSFEVVAERDGAWVRFPKVHHLKANARMRLVGCSTNPDGCTIEVRRDGPDGPLLGSCRIGCSQNQGPHDWMHYAPAFVDLKNEPGTLDLCVVLRGAGEDLYRLDWFCLV